MILARSVQVAAGREDLVLAGKIRESVWQHYTRKVGCTPPTPGTLALCSRLFSCTRGSSQKCR
ncbi:uncharacterized protein PHACADRAFT_266541 [Phanerochaete carnosa HHB-10118-sp]|uniref:Uncharacterized protein n=1 Tax=Phanerochaete carnosa (strain HHB-10118-sp) TaxID=650164 RepID=K5VPX0_PHACS|nr:uncharacterized protein PHACADRAFT_266240 [Phanerochaete carnosa HHB-10118-sp]XP_007403325.1 uncharacterized protein PHACADRAFT_266541 [Phanerochaete carnosa HHB-10118-sp]EKM48123.1 hypothetical protein PHACADRAFT_266541 [Phanerochaete carnosa HHB-10118-sp]EKM48634.1 hypothetical protein PHACADRAFT_266240 [Phanerochaete carnosa HHB-10118-sp]